MNLSHPDRLTAGCNSGCSEHLVRAPTLAHFQPLSASTGRGCFRPLVATHGARNTINERLLRRHASAFNARTLRRLLAGTVRPRVGINRQHIVNAGAGKLSCAPPRSGQCRKICGLDRGNLFENRACCICISRRYQDTCPFEPIHIRLAFHIGDQQFPPVYQRGRSGIRRNGNGLYVIQTHDIGHVRHAGFSVALH